MCGFTLHRYYSFNAKKYKAINVKIILRNIKGNCPLLLPIRHFLLRS